MELITQPNDWSCNACAWAMALGMSLEDMVADVGHDGSAIWNTTLPEPSNRTGFIDDQLIWLAVRRGFGSTVVFPASAVQARWGRKMEGRFCTDEEFEAFLRERHGVLEVKSHRFRGGLHACAWNGEKVYDPVEGIQDRSAYEVQCFLWVYRFPLNAGRPC